MTEQPRLRDKSAAQQQDFFLKKARPLVVFGRPRAGTRFVTNLLNSFPQVTLQGEIPDPVMGALVDFIGRVEHYYRDRADHRGEVGEKQFALWSDKKKALIFSFWAGASQAGRAQPTNGCRYFGYKRPDHEKYFDFYERHFAKDEAMYVFCIRNFVDNYLSIKSRWPARKIETVASQYLESIRRYHQAVSAAPGRVSLFNLDDHIAHGFDYTQAAVLEPLALRPSEAHRKKLTAQGPINTTEGDHGRKRRTELNRREQAFVESRPELDEMYKALCVPTWET